MSVHLMLGSLATVRPLISRDLMFGSRLPRDVYIIGNSIFKGVHGGAAWRCRHHALHQEPQGGGLRCLRLQRHLRQQRAADGHGSNLDLQ